MPESSSGPVVVGGAGSLTLTGGEPVPATLPDAYRGKAMGMRAVRDLLKASDLNWQFFSPAAVIARSECTGRYRLGTTALRDESCISVENYAHAVIDELESTAYEFKQMTIAY